MEKVRRVVSLWGPVAALVLIVLFLSGQEGLSFKPRVNWLGEGTLHAAAFSLLSLITLRAVPGRTLPWSILSLLAVAALAAGSEWYQSFNLPGLGLEADDLFFDLLGIVLAAVFWLGPAVGIAILAGREEGTFGNRLGRAMAWWSGGEALFYLWRAPSTADLNK